VLILPAARGGVRNPTRVMLGDQDNGGMGNRDAVLPPNLHRYSAERQAERHVRQFYFPTRVFDYLQ
jgi:hypothetical protein